jgi:hypothetical protein
MARQHATLWQQVQRDGFPLRLETPTTRSPVGPIGAAQQSSRTSPS